MYWCSSILLLNRDEWDVKICFDYMILWSALSREYVFVLTREKVSPFFTDPGLVSDRVASLTFDTLLFWTCLLKLPSFSCKSIPRRYRLFSTSSNVAFSNTGWGDICLTDTKDWNLLISNLNTLWIKADCENDSEQNLLWLSDLEAICLLFVFLKRGKDFLCQLKVW